MSNNGYGMLGHLGISFQTSFGTSNTTSLDWFPIISESLTDDIADLVAEGMRGRFEEGGSHEGAHTIAGDVVFEVHPILIGKLLKAWSGQSSSSQAGSVYQHLFVPRAQDWGRLAAVPPLTVEVYRDAGSAWLFSDMLLNELTLEVAAGGLWRGTASFVGGKIAAASKSTPSYAAGSEYPWDVTSISIAGAAVDNQSSFVWKGSNALEAKDVLNNSKYPGRVKRTGYRTVEVSGVAIFEDDAQYKVFRARTKQRLLVNVRGQSITGSQNTDLLLDVPQMLYTAYPPNIGGMGQTEVSFTAKGKFDTTSNYLSRWTLQNTRSAY